VEYNWRQGECVFKGYRVFDAKYKGHFEELDDRRWSELADETQSEHRHDIPQALAYAATSNARQITTVLVYLMRLPAWERLTARGRSLTVAEVSGGDRTVKVALAGVPIQLSRAELTSQLGDQADSRSKLEER
jgi:hypothetical protein